MAPIDNAGRCGGVLLRVPSLTKPRILVAMSGGVDSSVAALLLKQQGCDIVGAYMKNWINEDNVIGNCPWMQDIEDARAVCDHLGIEFRVVNLMQDYRERIVQYLLDGYAHGLTPNPDVMCNREIKFGVFRAWAKDHGFDAVATGHYARRVENCGSPIADGRSAEPEDGRRKTDDRGRRTEDGIAKPDTGNRIPDTGPAKPETGYRIPEIEYRESTGVGNMAAPVSHSAIRNPQSAICPPPSFPVSGFRSPVSYALWEGRDKNKDQSYFLALLNQEQLRDALFPIGEIEKPRLREIARKAGLPTANKKDSQGICFIGEVKMADFLRAYVPDAPGPIVRATDGRELGHHRGLHFYTLGQRKGIGIPSNTDNKAYVVVGKRAADRALLVAFDQPDAPGLFQSQVRIHSVSWIGTPVMAPAHLEARVRYRDPRVPIEYLPEPGNTAMVRFRDAQRGLASGQILALYDGERLLGGGVYV